MKTRDCQRTRTFLQAVVSSSLVLALSGFSHVYSIGSILEVKYAISKSWTCSKYRRARFLRANCANILPVIVLSLVPSFVGMSYPSGACASKKHLFVNHSTNRVLFYLLVFANPVLMHENLLISRPLHRSRFHSNFRRHSSIRVPTRQPFSLPL